MLFMQVNHRSSINSVFDIVGDLMNVNKTSMRDAMITKFLVVFCFMF